MHHSSHLSSRKKSAGFTLVEMLVVAPIVILALGGFIAVMVNMVGNVMITRDENAMTYDMQDALNTIDNDVNIASQFLKTTGTLSSPQGSDANFAGTAAFTSASGALLLSSFATNTNPFDPARQIIYFINQPNPCDDSKTANAILYTKTVYFINNGSLWRRTIVPNNNTNATPNAYTTCVAPWQQNSCSVGYSATLCKTNDVKVMSNISGMTINYYSTPGSTSDITATNADNATTVKVTLTGSKTTAGRPFSVTLSTRSTKLN